MKSKMYKYVFVALILILFAVSGVTALGEETSDESFEKTELPSFYHEINK